MLWGSELGGRHHATLAPLQGIWGGASSILWDPLGLLLPARDMLNLQCITDSFPFLFIVIS